MSVNEVRWSIDTPAGPLALSGGRVTLERGWVPQLIASVTVEGPHPLMDELYAARRSREPLLLRVQTVYGQSVALGTLTEPGGSLGDVTWPAVPSGTAGVEQRAWHVYVLAISEDRLTGTTSIELASAEALLQEARNGGRDYMPSRDATWIGGRPRDTVAQLFNEVIHVAGLAIPVFQSGNDSPIRDDETLLWATGQSLWAYLQANLRLEQSIELDPETNVLRVRDSSYTSPPIDYITSPDLIASQAVVGDSTELGDLDYADGFIVRYSYRSGGGENISGTKVYLAAGITDWRDVTKWRELTLENYPQDARMQAVLNRAAQARRQGTHTLTINGYTLQNVLATASRLRYIFSIDEMTITVTAPLPQEV